MQQQQTGVYRNLQMYSNNNGVDSREGSQDRTEEDVDEEMQRELAEDAQWKKIQQNTFTRWSNEHLKVINKFIDNLETDLSDGLKLIGLVEVLAHKKLPKHNKRPNFRSQKLENVSVALQFLEEVEHIKIVNIDSSDIVDGKLKLILGLIWTLILHYSISMPIWEGDEGDEKLGPKQRLLGWIQGKVDGAVPINNFTTDWNDGRAIGALVDAVAPGLCPDWAEGKPENATDNAKKAMDAADEWLGVPQLVTPEEMTNPNCDELSMMTYLSQYPNAKLKDGAPAGPPKPSADPSKVKVYGPGVEPTGNMAGFPTSFTVETFSAGKGKVEVIVLNPKGQPEPTEVTFNNDANLSYTVVYKPSMQGNYKVIVKFGGSEVPGSPFPVAVESGGGPGMVIAQGPGLEPTGVAQDKMTHFEIKPKDGGRWIKKCQMQEEKGVGAGNIDVVILDPAGKKDSVKTKVTDKGDGSYICEYAASQAGLHSVNIFFSGEPIPKSPFGVKVSPAVDSKKCKAFGRGLQSKGVRVGDIADFKVITEGAGPGELKVTVIGPGGKEEKVDVAHPDEHTFECKYYPNKPGKYVVTIVYGGQAIPRSPFEVNVGKQITSKIVAYGPGLKEGIVGCSADFTVETNGETGALGFSIEGPSQAKIDCHDNGDGSADVKYWPTAPGEYAVHILCNDEDIPNSPYMAQIQPATNEFSPYKVKAYGPGLEKTGVLIGAPTKFTVDTSQAPAGKAPLEIIAMDQDYKPVEVKTVDKGKGIFECTYTPELPIKHTVLINYGGVAITGSPFRVYVSEPSLPDKVKVSGPGIEPGVKTNAFTYFNVDCKDAGPGDVSIALIDDKGGDVPFDINDNADGTFTIRYSPTEPVKHTVTILFADVEIPKSPFIVDVKASVDANKIKVANLDKTARVGEQKLFNVITAGAVNPPHASPCTAVLTSPSGAKVPVNVAPVANGFQGDFTLQEPGPHTLKLEIGGAPVPGTPAKIEGLPEAEPGKVKAYGPGLTGGVTGSPAMFTIDTKEAGNGGLGVTVEGPCEAEIDCKDNGDGTCTVAYHPLEAGEYQINITFAEQHIPGSPFNANILPDVRGVSVIMPNEAVFLDTPTTFKIDASAIDKKSEAKIDCVITNPSKAKTDATIKPLGNGVYEVGYTPVEVGPHTIDLAYGGVPVPGAPFPVTVQEGCNPQKCRAFGPGLEKGATNVPQFFTVETKGAGTGGLGLAIEGPSEAKMTCKDNRDGSCSVEYLPTKAGEYEIIIKFADQHIPGSPFMVHCEDPVEPGKVKVTGPLVGQGKVRKAIPATCTVDTTGCGKAPLEVAVTDGKGKKQLLKPTQISETVCEFQYMAQQEGKAKVDVSYGGKPVPKSPFNINVLPTYSAGDVKVSGPGVQAKGVCATLPTDFHVDAKDAGVAELEVVVKDTEGKLSQPIVNNNGNMTYDVAYKPEEIGKHEVTVKYGGDHVKGSPFPVNVGPTGNPNKCKISGNGTESTVFIGNDYTIDVDASQAGKGAVTCRIRSASGSDLDIDIMDNRDGTFNIFYTPRAVGTYDVKIKFGGQEIPGGSFTVMAAEESQFRSVDLVIPIPGFFNNITANVTMPSGKTAKPNLKDNGDGSITVHYQPTEIGLHQLDIFYSGEHIQGSPFMFHVDAINSGYVTAYGPGLSHGICDEPCSFTIVTKDAGPGGLALAVEGPSKAEITCQDNKDGTCSVSYLPTAPGEYNIVVKFADKHIMGSPFTAKITGVSKQKAAVTVGSSSEVSLKVTEADISALTATIRSPAGVEEPCQLKKLANGHLGISFTPRMVGEHLVSVLRAGKHIANSPFKITVGESEIGDASRVKVFGQGLKQGYANAVNEFVVNTKEAGYGGLSLSIEGPSKADIECQDNEDGSCRVTYKPTEPGNYIINVKFADQHVPGSPFTVKVSGEGSMKSECITRRREAADITNVGSQCELSLKIPGTTVADMTASVTSPLGVVENCEILDLGDCNYSIKFVPRDMGIHSVSVKHKGLHIPGSPFQFTVGPLKDGGAHKVRAGGPGLEKGEVGLPNEFMIWTREAGAGGLSIAMEGPAKAEIDFEDRKDGSCSVSYVTTEPGEYLVSIKFNDTHIPDSPFKVPISAAGAPDAQRMTIQQLREKGLQVGKPATFNVQFNGAQGHLDARVVAPSGAEDEAALMEVEKGHYAVRFVPKENGTHQVHVRFNGQHIPGSPFKVLVGGAEGDPGRVTVSGAGLSQGRTGEKCEFVVNTSQAGAGALAITVDGPSKVALDCKEVPEGYKVSYTPLAPGDYLITIKFAGNHHISGSPYKAVISGSAQSDSGKFHEQSTVVVETVTKSSSSSVQQQQQAVATQQQPVAEEVKAIKATGIGLKKAFVGKKNVFNVDTKMAPGSNMLLVGVYGPKYPCDEVFVKHQGGGQYNVSYILKEKGEYVLVCKWGDHHIPGSPFKLEVV